MADYRLLIPFILKWEGGYSKHKADAAAKGIPIELNGIHTNKGITWQTYQGNSQRLFGKLPTPEGFLNLTDEEWGIIFKNLYWNYTRADEFISQKLAHAVVDFLWGSGYVHPTYILQKLLNTYYGFNLKLDGIVGNMTMKAINSVDNQEQLYTLYMMERVLYIQAIVRNNQSQQVFEQGWLNRLFDLVKYNK